MDTNRFIEAQNLFNKMEAIEKKMRWLNKGNFDKITLSTKSGVGDVTLTTKDFLMVIDIIKDTLSADHDEYERMFKLV